LSEAVRKEYKWRTIQECLLPDGIVPDGIVHDGIVQDGACFEKGKLAERQGRKVTGLSGGSP
jgi:hypothetical protein